jgi:hypothetical protein
MKKIKEFAKVYLEYPDEKVLKDDELEELRKQKEELEERRLIISREEILKRLSEKEVVHVR